ncbi:MAG: DUF4199 domain-containing protein [bacterium]
MRKVTLIFGLLAGAIISVVMVVAMVMWEKGTMTCDNSNDLVGYASMVIALSMVFFGIKSYRDNYQNGAIKFTKGLQVGLLISLVASLMYVATWETYYQIRPDAYASFVDQYADHHVNKMKENGASPAEIDEKIKEMADMKEMIKNPVLRFGMTLMELFPVGIIITLISAAVLRKKEFLPA